MISRDESNDRSLLDAYLDGQLAREDAERMARAVDASAPLRAEVELQARIDGSLRRLFPPVALSSDLVARLRAAAPAEPVVVPRPRRRRLLQVALAAAATLIWGALAWQYFADSGASRYHPNRPLADIYEVSVADGFRPKWLCDDDREFISTFAKRQGQGLRLVELPPGRKMAGLAYFGGLSRYTTALLARVDGTPVLVFVDRATADTRPELTQNVGGLHIFHKTLGSLVLYEVTPFAEPRILDYLEPADLPAAE